jgi:hypothetical protein
MLCSCLQFVLQTIELAVVFVVILLEFYYDAVQWSKKVSFKVRKLQIWSSLTHLSFTIESSPHFLICSGKTPFDWNPR